MTDQIFGSQKKGSLRDNLPIEGKTGRPVTPDSSNILNLAQGTQIAQVRREQEPGLNTSNRKRNKRNKLVRLIVACSIVIIALFTVSSFFHSAKISIQPKKTTAAIVKSFKAVEEKTEGQLTFTRVASIEGEDTIFLEGTIEENVQTKATGTILLKNTTSAAQRFIANTRFESQDGKIYRTPRSIQLSANSSQEVQVIADQPGEEYNVNSGMTFLLPGLKGTPNYGKFTGTQVGTFSGGYSGIVKTAPQTAIDTAKQTVTQQIQKKLREDLVSKVTEGYIMAEPFIDFDEVEYIQVPNELRGGLNITAKTAIRGIAFKKSEFDAYVASEILPDYILGQSIEITNIDELELRVVTDTFDVAKSKEFEFSLKGDAEFNWVFDEEKILEAIAGKSKSFVERGLAAELSLAKAIKVSIAPFWFGSIPKNTDRIKITIINK